MKTQPRYAFTLFQLLVVLAIFAILLGLFLPAVQKVRQAAERMQSMNNMKQIGLACHNYYSTFDAFPSGVDDNHFGASARLLPYIEQANISSQIDFKKSIDDATNLPMRKLVIKTFLNEQDPVPPMIPGFEFGSTNYLFNAGSKPAIEADPKKCDGVFYTNSKTKMTEITDGTSNTLMTGETLRGDGGKQAVDVRRQYVLLDKNALKGLKDDAGVQEFKDNKNIAGNRGSSWMDGRFLQGMFTGTRVANDEKPDVDCGGSGGLSALRSMPGTPVNVGMCDGSVRAITKELKLEIWNHLTSRNDGNVIPPF
jgi:prepilin-type processing-associated H-X9-DG protein